VQSPINANNNNESSPAFTIRGNLTLTNPSTGTESWDAGNTYPINWSYIGPVQNVTIQYCANGTLGSPWINLTDSTGALNGTWNWTISSSTELSTKASIKIFDRDQPLSESISQNFTIKGALRVDAPNATGIVLRVSDPYNINWTKFGAIQYVNISYSNNSTAGPWKTIANNILAVNQTYPWTIPDDISNAARVKVMDVDNPAVTNTSSNDFKIVGNLQVNAPVDGDKWIVDTTRSINWTPTGNFTNVTIIASKDNFATNWTINESVPAGTSGVLQTYNYVVDDYISDTVKVRVYDGNATRSSLVLANSTGNTSIKGKVTVTAPPLNTTLYANQTYQYIEWTTNGTIGNVTIRLWDGTGWYAANITNSTCSGPGCSGKGASTYTWQLPLDVKHETCKINITDESDVSVFNESVNFHIRPKINVTSPVLDQNVKVATNYPGLIQWNITGTTVSFVDIKYDTDNGNNRDRKSVV
jgi:hypothetical protein